MPDSKYFGIPFGASGDRATIPEAAQPSGVVSFAQGFGPDYERDPATDPLAKRVPRDETNEYLYQITNALKFLQLYGLPEWYQNDDSGNRVSYSIAARVRHAGAAYVSLVANNQTTPGTAPTSWALDEAFSVGAVEATLAQMLAGTDATRLATPRRVASAVQAGQYNFVVGAGSATAQTGALAPAPSQYYEGMTFVFVPNNTNTGAMTFNANDLGAVPILRMDGTALTRASVRSGIPVTLVYRSGSFYATSILLPRLTTRVIVTAGQTFTVPAGVFQLRAEVVGGGGGGGAGGGGNNFAGGGGGGGGYADVIADVTPGQTFTVTIGAAGVRGGDAGNNGGAGGTTSFGSLAVATGGAGGAGSLAAGGRGGEGTTGTLRLFGNDGGDGNANSASALAGNGGSSIFGGAGRAGKVLANGSGGGFAGRGYGAGGGGSYDVGAGFGGAGAPGVCIISY